MIRREYGDKLVKSEEMMSPEEALLDNRVLCVFGPIVPYPHRYDNMSATYVTDMLLCMASKSTEPIYMLIDSPGGLVSTGLVLYDTMRMIDVPVYTISRNSASMASIILAAGEKGHRYVYPNSRTMIHLPSGQLAGDAGDIEIGATEIKKAKELLVDILLENGATQSKKKILKDIDRDFWMNANETIKYGLADAIADTELFKKIRALNS